MEILSKESIVFVSLQLYNLYATKIAYNKYA